ncbi:hypothetical protein DLAC_07367 [Tieghemostelium lacteum]|uniref:J domain-containing protein n=1 Tax=Tieghemostelium lacteum TaxID=361077 RepID=A0A151ZCD1_TIELA|nr:hypothetical protein DLAC_07367 [Tieghemostelium lacteum]|eukprot:KYQ91600.1 hypothetical protein DLAC_07367 [Tieghemostelium lacteum]
MKRSLYDVLGIDDASKADFATIKKAYYNMALKYHPDKTTGSDGQPNSVSESEFIEIKDAYETLIDPTKKLNYDKRNIIDQFASKHEDITGCSQNQQQQQQQQQQQPKHHTFANCQAYFANLQKNNNCSNILNDIINNSYITTPQQQQQKQQQHGYHGHGHGHGHGYGHHHGLHHFHHGNGLNNGGYSPQMKSCQDQCKRSKHTHNIYAHNVVINNSFGSGSTMNDGRGVVASSSSIKGSNVTITLNITHDESIDGCYKCVQYERMDFCDCEKLNGICQHVHGVMIVLDGVKVNVPAGVIDGTKQIYQEMGNLSHSGIGQYGDLIVQFKVEEHPIFKRDGNDVISELTISFIDAILGNRITVPFLYGSMQVDIPPCSQHGQILKIKGQGYQSPQNSNQKGDHYLKILIELPKSITPEQSILLQQYKNISTSSTTPTSTTTTTTSNSGT